MTGQSTKPQTGDSKDFLTMTVDGQVFGIPVLQVQDVLGEQRVTAVPLAPPEVAGSLNLRGRIVTAINLRRRLGLEPVAEGAKTMSVVVDYQGELYSLIVDGVGEVLSLSDSDFEKTPPTLDRVWREVATGVYRLKNDLLVILDVSDMLEALYSRDHHAA
ncbi:MAG: chemotaxis protein CheW [Alphaproteobacteria bacterium]|nr:chemotaxis protein CheW [Alphaproteobacteria bacterium]